MNKFAKIRLRNGQEYYLNKEVRDQFNAFYKNLKFYKNIPGIIFYNKLTGKKL